MVVLLLCWIVTFIWTTDRSNWFIENALTAIFLVFISSTHRFFKFSDLSYTLMFVFLLLHIYGAMHSYSENPLGNLIRNGMHLQRNPYDRIVHFSFGFLLAYPLRDYFLCHLRFEPWLAWTMPVVITLALSTLYEITEWLVAAIFFPAQGPAYLGLQGDVWDAQKDAFVAFVGAFIISVMAFFRPKR